MEQQGNIKTEGDNDPKGRSLMQPLRDAAYERQFLIIGFVVYGLLSAFLAVLVWAIVKR